MTTSTINIKEYLDSFSKNVGKISVSANRILSEAADEFKKRVEDRTPVGNPALWAWPAPKDYEPGTLKASWQISKTSSAQGAGGRFVSDNSILSLHGLLAKVNFNTTYATIYNQQPYAQRVEDGWSTQAPNGMMKITVKEFPQIVDSIAAKYRL